MAKADSVLQGYDKMTAVFRIEEMYNQKFFEAERLVVDGYPDTGICIGIQGTLYCKWSVSERRTFYLNRYYSFRKFDSLLRYAKSCFELRGRKEIFPEKKMELLTPRDSLLSLLKEDIYIYGVPITSDVDVQSLVENRYNAHEVFSKQDLKIKFIKNGEKYVIGGEVYDYSVDPNEVLREVKIKIRKHLEEENLSEIKQFFA